jgi:uncharacterized protein
MLVEFSVENYLSFKDKVTLSMVASSIKELDNNFVTKDKLKILKMTSIYGPNASGKSNLIKALKFVRKFVLESHSQKTNLDKIDIDIFRLSTDTENKPSKFEVIFYIDLIRYRYGFSVTNEEVIEEYLYFVPKKMEALLFSRNKTEIHIGKHFKSKARLSLLKQLIRANGLFLSLDAQNNGEESNKVFEWFNNCIIISGLNDSEFVNFTLAQIDNGEGKKITDFINKFDINVQDIRQEKIQISRDNLPENFPSILKEMLFNNEQTKQIEAISILFRHNKYDSENKIINKVDLSFQQSESDGTQKLFALAGLFNNLRKKNSILIIDEFDARLHPTLTRSLIKFFNSDIAYNNAQLIFTTHDVKLMDKELFRRDQIWFTTKDDTEATQLYSLLEYKKGIRNDEKYEKNYLLGRYGAIPYINELVDSFN